MSEKPIVFDKLEVNKVVDKYVENESLAVLHVYLEKLDGTPLYSNSRQDFSYIGILLMKIPGLEYGQCRRLSQFHLQWNWTEDSIK